MLFSRFEGARMRAEKRATKCYAVKSNRRRIRARIYIERIVTRLYTVAGNEIKKKFATAGVEGIDARKKVRKNGGGDAANGGNEGTT